MAISVYTGLMGSGKTYEAILNGIIPAIKAGRRVVTNISGVNSDKIRDYLVARGSALDKLGHVFHVANEAVSQPGFFPGEGSSGLNSGDSEIGPSVVQPGDFVVIDEAWRYWSGNDKLTEEHKNFFRMHRHYVGADGVACDLLVIIQDFASLIRFLRGVCELVLVFQKLKVLGFSSRYRVEVYEGRPTKKSLVSTSPLQKYDPAIFPLYKSYDGNAGKENATDDRQNLFKNKLFLASMLLGFCLLIFGGKWFYSYVGRLHGGGADAKASGVIQAQALSSTPVDPKTGQPLPPRDKLTLASDVRLVAVLEPSIGETIVIFQLPDGRFVRKHMTAGIVDGWQSVAAYDGRMVGFYFGGKAK